MIKESCVRTASIQEKVKAIEATEIGERPKNETSKRMSTHSKRIKKKKTQPFI